VLDLDKAYRRRMAHGRGRSPRSGGGRARDPNVLLAAYLASLGSVVKSWHDPTSDAYFTFSTGAQISAWVGRIGAQVLSQGTSANQPLRDLATAVLGGKNTVKCDGSNDSLAAVANPNFWKFLHDGTGYAGYVVHRTDSTGNANQSLLYSAGAVAQVGIHIDMQAARVVESVFNGSGVAMNTWNLVTASHFARDVSRYQMFGYTTGTQLSRVSGSSLTNADTAGTPSAANPTTNLFVGNGNTAWKGYLGDLIFLSRTPTAGEHAQITSLLAQKWAVAA